MSFQGSTEWMQDWCSSNCWWQTVPCPGGSDKKRSVTQWRPVGGTTSAGELDWHRINRWWEEDEHTNFVGWWCCKRSVRYGMWPVCSALKVKVASNYAPLKRKPVKLLAECSGRERRTKGCTHEGLNYCLMFRNVPCISLSRVFSCRSWHRWYLGVSRPRLRWLCVNWWLAMQATLHLCSASFQANRLAST